MAEGEQDANAAELESSANSQPENSSANTPEGAKPSLESQPEGTEGKENQPFHEHPRFKELVREKNESKLRADKLEREMESMRSQVASQLNKKETLDPVEQTFKKLRDNGVGEKEARLLAESQVEAAKSVVEQRVAPVEAASLQAAVDRAVEEFAKEHSDFKSVQPQMFELYKSLPDADQAYLSKSPNGLQWLYDHVQSSKIDEIKKSEFERGRKEGYQNKKGKESFAPSGGGIVKTPGANLTEEDIMSMSTEEYGKRRTEILASRGIR